MNKIIPGAVGAVLALSLMACQPSHSHQHCVSTHTITVHHSKTSRTTTSTVCDHWVHN